MSLIIIIILRLPAMGSQELQYVSNCRSSETQPFPFFLLLKILLRNEVSIWKHMSISEGQKRCRGKGRDLKMKAEGEASHYN